MANSEQSGDAKATDPPGIAGLPKNQEEFEANLGAILSANETKVIISGLMAQARLNSKDVLV
jgi:hypothetical protein